MYPRDRDEALTMRGVEVRLHAGTPGCTVVVRALRGVDLTVVAGELVAVCGAAASGKTVLLLTAAGLLAPARGEVRRGGAVVVADVAGGAWRGVRDAPGLVLADDVPDAVALRRLRARAARLEGAAVLAAMCARAGVARAELEAHAAGARVVRLALGRLSASAPHPAAARAGAAGGRVASVAEPS